MWLHGADLVWRYFDLGASFIWAVSGALLAARRGYDLTGICAVALVSATGGGLLRDGFFLQQGPPAMLQTPVYIAAAALAGVMVWALGSQGRLLAMVQRCAALVDAIGLGGFAVVGMQLALRAGIGIPGVLLIGVVNAVGGSVLRSILLHETPEVFRPGELTAVAALIGCLAHVALTVGLGLDPKSAAAITVALVALLRGGSVRLGIRTRAARGFAEPQSAELP